MSSDDQIIKVLAEDNERKDKALADARERLKKSQESEHKSGLENFELRNKIDRLESRIEILMGEDGRELYTEFPDIYLHRNRWRTERLSSAKANALATNADIRHNCGCCADSPLEIWPYMLYKGHKIFSNPCGTMIGEKDGYGDRPYEGWKEKLIEANISAAVIEIAEAYFQANDPRGDFDDEAENESTD